MQESLKKKALRRLNLIRGQVNGLAKMVEGDRYCVDILTQSSAIREALSGVEDIVLENHLSTHVLEQMRTGKQKRATDEIMKVYKLKRK